MDEISNLKIYLQKLKTELDKLSNNSKIKEKQNEIDAIEKTIDYYELFNNPSNEDLLNVSIDILDSSNPFNYVQNTKALSTLPETTLDPNLPFYMINKEKIDLLTIEARKLIHLHTTLSINLRNYTNFTNLKTIHTKLKRFPEYNKKNPNKTISTSNIGADRIYSVLTNLKENSKLYEPMSKDLIQLFIQNKDVIKQELKNNPFYEFSQYDNSDELYNRCQILKETKSSDITPIKEKNKCFNELQKASLYYMLNCESTRNMSLIDNNIASNSTNNRDILNLTKQIDRLKKQLAKSQKTFFKNSITVSNSEDLVRKIARKESILNNLITNKSSTKMTNFLSDYMSDVEFSTSKQLFLETYNIEPTKDLYGITSKEIISYTLGILSNNSKNLYSELQRCRSINSSLDTAYIPLCNILKISSMEELSTIPGIPSYIQSLPKSPKISSETCQFLEPYNNDIISKFKVLQLKSTSKEDYMSNDK